MTEMRGQVVYWCSDCGRFYAPAADRAVCPACGRRSTVMRCTRCGHEWTLRGAAPPKVCPGRDCKSKYWNRTRVLKERIL